MLDSRISRILPLAQTLVQHYVAGTWHVMNALDAVLDPVLSDVELYRASFLVIVRLD